MAPKCPPHQTVALCGLNAGVGREEIQKLLDKHSKGVVTSFSEPRKDSRDQEGLRRIVFVNCSSPDAAAKLCQALHEREDKELGVPAVKNRLQAVKKNALSSVDWSRFTSKEKRTLEGASVGEWVT